MPRPQPFTFPNTIRYEPRTKRNVMRKRGIGASEIPAIAGLSEFTSPRDVWREKTGLAAFEGNQATRIGNFFEPYFFAYLQTYHFDGFVMQRNNGIYFQTDHEAKPLPHYCTPDGFAVNFTTPKPVLIELKVSSYFSKKRLACAEAQVQYTMHLLDVDEAKVCVLQGTKVDIVKIPRDREEGKRLYALAREFWEYFVVKGVEP
ncbi:MAG: YqaJ viral recombinase family protein [Ignavibacteria bacterium]|nr:YqaJ viral recombinase family protein [Ignavibacteria bacterium]